MRRTLASTERFEAQVGVFADRAARSDGESNAQIGMEHEFGVVTSGYNLPQRSFLQMPIHEHGADALNPKDLGRALVEGNPLTVVGAAAKDAVLTAFATGGYGQWPSLHPMTVENKGHDTILIDTEQLVGAIDSRVALKGEK